MCVPVLSVLLSGKPHLIIVLIPKFQPFFPKSEDPDEPSSIDRVVHENLRRKMDTMYQWLNDPSLSPQLSSLEPMISEVELEMISAVGQA